MDNKTIYALSTVFGKSGVGVIRISGKDAFTVIDKMTNLDAKKISSHHSKLATIFDSRTHQELDKALVLCFCGPHSFTGEDTVEINCHGSKAVIRSIIDSLSAIEGFRLAEPGEFSRRSFYNGKMDLTAADGLADLIEAETSLQQQVALKQMGGNLLNLYDNWREQLLEILAYIEAYIDFPDEDIPEDVYHNLLNSVFKISGEIKNHLNSNKNTER